MSLESSQIFLAYSAFITAHKVAQVRKGKVDRHLLVDGLQKKQLGAWGFSPLPHRDDSQGETP